MAAAPTSGRGASSRSAGGAETARLVCPGAEFDVAQEPLMTEMVQIQPDVEKQLIGNC
jgi:hypothetical protein